MIIGIILLSVGLLLSIFTLLYIRGNTDGPLFLAILVSFSMFAPVTIVGIVLTVIQGRNIKLYVVERDAIIARMSRNNR